MNSDLLKEVEARDKQCAAIHEAGHLTVACSLGHRARAWITPTGATDPFANRLWAGQCGSGCNAAEFAVAGLVAERWAEDGAVSPDYSFAGEFWRLQGRLSG